MTKFKILISTALFWAISITTTATCHAIETIRINGSGIALDMMKPLITAYLKTNHNVHIEMGKPLGSSGATKALIAGALDIAVCSRSIKHEEAAQGVTQKKYGKTPLVIVTEMNVPKYKISTRELEDIFTGKLVSWDNGEKIRLILRPQEDIDTKILRKLSNGMNIAIDIAHARPGMIMAITDPESYSAIARTPGGIGTTGMNSIISKKLNLKILTLNGIKPTLKTISNGTYPLVKEINFSTTAKTSPTALRLIGYIFSPQGRAIAQKSGVLVISGLPQGK